MKKKNGFTLLEILLVIGLLATLAVVVIMALDPAKRFEDARNARRLSDIQSILGAIQQYMVDNRGAIPGGINDVERQIGVAGENCELINNNCNVTQGDCVNLSSDLARYLKDLPFDPENGSSDRTNYSVIMDSNNIITVKACYSSDQSISSVSR